MGNGLEIIASQLTSQIELAGKLYYRLILVISDRTLIDDLRNITAKLGINYINVNLELSRQLLELTQRQRSIKAQRLLEEIIGNTKEGVVFLDGIEILFDVSLKLDPLKCLQGLSRNRTVVAAWRGNFENNYLIYAEPNHPEYHCYLKADFLLIDLRKSEDNFSG